MSQSKAEVIVQMARNALGLATRRQPPSRSQAEGQLPGKKVECFNSD